MNTMHILLHCICITYILSNSWLSISSQIAKQILVQINDIEDMDNEAKNEIFENAASFSRKVTFINYKLSLSIVNCHNMYV